MYNPYLFCRGKRGCVTELSVCLSACCSIYALFGVAVVGLPSLLQVAATTASLLHLVLQKFTQSLPVAVLQIVKS